MKELYGRWRSFENRAAPEEQEEMKFGARRDIEKELDRSLELFKQLRSSNRPRTWSNWRSWRRSRRDPSEESDKGGKSAEQLAEEQAELDRKFDEVSSGWTSSRRRREGWRTLGTARTREPQEEPSTSSNSRATEQLKQDEKKKAGKARRRPRADGAAGLPDAWSSMQNPSRSSRKGTWTPCGNSWRTSCS